MADSAYLCRTPVHGWVEIWRKGVYEAGFTLMRSQHNLITNVGKAEFANLQIAAGTAPSHASVGTGVVAAVVTDTILGLEIYRAAAVRSRVTITVANDTAYYDTTINCVASFDVTEAGLFNNATANLGTLFARQVFTAVPVAAGVVLKVIWKLQN